MSKKAITTTEEIENLTEETFGELERWQIASLDRQQIIRLTQKKLELGFELESNEKTLLGIAPTGKELIWSFFGFLINLGLIFIGLTILYYIMIRMDG